MTFILLVFISYLYHIVTNYDPFKEAIFSLEKLGGWHACVNKPTYLKVEACTHYIHNVLLQVVNMQPNHGI